MVETVKLENGLRIVMEDIPYVRSIAFGIWINTGTRCEKPEENGVSHFIEHLMFKGTKKRSSKDIAEEMDAMGGQINAYTTKEYTCYYTRTLDRHFDHAIDVLSDMILNSRFDDADIDREREERAPPRFRKSMRPRQTAGDSLYYSGGLSYGKDPDRYYRLRKDRPDPTYSGVCSES